MRSFGVIQTVSQSLSRRGGEARLEAPECAMVAGHLSDLKAGKSNGLRAIYVEMPSEEDWSDELVKNARTEGWVDLWIPAGQEGFVTMVERLGVEVYQRMRRN
ncbi:hypothetical protein V2W45_1487784 [Cenococcum geophilum]